MTLSEIALRLLDLGGQMQKLGWPNVADEINYLAGQLNGTISTMRGTAGVLHREAEYLSRQGNYTATGAMREMAKQVTGLTEKGGAE